MPSYRAIPRRIKTDSDKNVHVRRLGVQWQLTPESKREAQQPAPEPVENGSEVDYRELQAQAKERGIPANQSKEDLAAAIEASDD